MEALSNLLALASFSRCSHGRSPTWADVAAMNGLAGVIGIARVQVRLTLGSATQIVEWPLLARRGLQSRGQRVC